jgi:hypothetical protein
MADMYERLFNLNRNRQLNDAKEKNERKSALSKRKFQEILQKKFQTTFIGAISQIELEFGFLWGNNKNIEDCTPTEKEWFERWQRLRTRILDNGNNQLRAVENELEQYAMTFNGYQYNCIPKQEESSNG